MHKLKISVAPAFLKICMTIESCVYFSHEQDSSVFLAKHNSDLNIIHSKDADKFVHLNLQMTSKASQFVLC